MKKIAAFFILILLFITNDAPVQAVSSTKAASDKGILYLRSQQKPDGQIDGFSGVSDWAAMSFSVSGVDTATVASPSGQALLQWLESNPPTTSSKANDWARRILAVTAIDQNPYNFTGNNLVNGLKSNFNNHQIGDVSADNDDMFGLLALLASKVSSTNSMVTDITSFIISHQHTDGGFSYSTDPATGSDIDDTAAAIMALVAANSQGIIVTNLQTSIDNAKNYILSHQNTDGGFAYDPNPATSWDTTSNVSSTSWVNMALSSLGLTDDTHFLNAQDYLISTEQPDGSFPYNLSTTYGPVQGDTFDTAYTILALNNAFWPIHIFSGTVPTDTPLSPTGLPTSTPTPVQSSSEIANTPTPSPTPISTVETDDTIETIETPIPTTTYKSTDMPQQTQAMNTILTVSPEVTEIPTPEPAVLGTKIKSKIKPMAQDYHIPITAQISFGLGVLFLIAHFGRIIFSSYFFTQK